jgi:hypothetical protein
VEATRQGVVGGPGVCQPRVTILDVEATWSTAEQGSRVNLPDLEPDPVIEAYKRDVDLSILRANLRRTPAERIANLQAMVQFAEELRRGRSRRALGGP